MTVQGAGIRSTYTRDERLYRGTEHLMYQIKHVDQYKTTALKKFYLHLTPDYGTGEQG